MSIMVIMEKDKGFSLTGNNQFPQRIICHYEWHRKKHQLIEKLRNIEGRERRTLLSLVIFIFIN